MKEIRWFLKIKDFENEKKVSELALIAPPLPQITPHYFILIGA